MGSTALLPWIHVNDYGKLYDLLGYHTPFGKLMPVLAIVTLLLLWYNMRDAHTAARIGVGVGILEIFRIVTGETITMTELGIAYGVYVMLGASLVMFFGDVVAAKDRPVFLARMSFFSDLPRLCSSAERLPVVPVG